MPSTFFFWWDLGLNSGLLTCKAGALPLKPLSHPSSPSSTLDASHHPHDFTNINYLNYWRIDAKDTDMNET
jgi:hypothetical protein